MKISIMPKESSIGSVDRFLQPQGMFVWRQHYRAEVINRVVVSARLPHVDRETLRPIAKSLEVRTFRSFGITGYICCPHISCG